MENQEYENTNIKDKIQEVNISGEMKTSFLSYAMSVIVARALPDVRDGLKPVHRRILYGMDELGVYPDKQYKKSARIVGDVMGKYHPHGDSAIYDSMVRMAQDFSYRYPLVNGHGNFGSVDGDGAAAMRYTEAKMEKITVEMLKDLRKDTVDFVDNYDGSEQEPKVLPARFPNLLVNGANGIAVGMSTVIPPHNLTEVIEGYIAYIRNQDIEDEELMEYIKGPDFPTGGIILGMSGIREAYLTGHGTIRVKAKAEIKDMASGKKQIIIKEIPYQVNKSNLIDKIAELAKDKRIEGITDLRDESNRNGMRIVLELRKDANPEVILNNLYKNSQLQASYGVNMLALVDDKPMILSLKEIIKYYFEHQTTVLIRRTKFDLDKAIQRDHLLKGFIIALDNIDEVIKIIRESYDDTEQKLIERYGFSDVQTKAILAMQLRKLSGMERDKIHAELAEIEKAINYYNQILVDKELQHEILVSEAEDVKNKYGDARRTEIDLSGDYDIEDEDLIPIEDVIVAVTTNGYVKRMNVAVYKSQNRGGRGKTGMKINEDDVIDSIISTSTHDYLLFFTNLGRVYKIKGYRIPNYGRNSKGLPIVNLLNLTDGEGLAAVMSVKDFNEGYLFFTTTKGVVKRTKVSAFQNIRTNGIRALSLRDGDQLHSVKLTDGNRDVIIGASNGKAIRFNEQDVRSMGRDAAGVKGIALSGKEEVIGVTTVTVDRSEILAITAKGYGKRTDVDEYRLQGRGGKGVKTINVTTKNGCLKKLISVVGDEDLLVVTDKGMIIRVPIDQIAQTKRSTQGVKIINVLDGHEVATIAIVPKEEDDDENMESIDDNSEITEETNDNISANQEQQKPIREFHMEEYKELNHFVEEDEEENEEDDEEESDVDDILKDSY
ncbi:MAG TPA: DNA gyrase subunit A [Bacillota bacterium]|nr:DNA gyrase subunit A [Bacillota bacterium]HPF42087.1 DNA gyrase subunit A [Bacillota bacterium]HPJ85809.1 DNA gyrase subunit A [Bacillota bacterium]HPQ61534.1 DNA gyrase subunit A [Bacillota bacterium]HRX91345.1 DNA gyrase subunit A [Candidatus Izemoplasmatales bacterium]